MPSTEFRHVYVIRCRDVRRSLDATQAAVYIDSRKAWKLAITNAWPNPRTRDFCVNSKPLTSPSRSSAIVFECRCRRKSTMPNAKYRASREEENGKRASNCRSVLINRIEKGGRVRSNVHRDISSRARENYLVVSDERRSSIINDVIRIRLLTARTLQICFVRHTHEDSSPPFVLNGAREDCDRGSDADLRRRKCEL